MRIDLGIFFNGVFQSIASFDNFIRRNLLQFLKVGLLRNYIFNLIDFRLVIDQEMFLHLNGAWTKLCQETVLCDGCELW